ncbi:YceI family protein [uncultured Dokdonia sp.]|uniref:YceI family protein n=1 Tax=uncultured Dokdonia sp. TaxID=575653 RepID=UPI0026020AE7|nr:YceI family protein [uncultured Dokdonia sp.]
MQKLFITLMILTSTVVTSQVQNISVTHPLDHQKSVLHWKGSYTFNISEHNGVVYFKRGELTTKGDQITGGSFVIDMLSIDNVPNSDHKGPIEHLKDSDFFDVYKFPVAKLVLTSVEYFPNTNTHEIFADLTIKGITQNIKFYADIDGIKNTMKAHFKIDRTRWGITYNNKAKDKAISDAVEFKAELYF